MKSLNINPYNNKGRKHGLWVMYNDFDIWYKGRFFNGIVIGYHLFNGKYVGEKEHIIEKYYYIK